MMRKALLALCVVGLFTMPTWAATGTLERATQANGPVPEIVQAIKNAVPQDGGETDAFQGDG